MGLLYLVDSSAKFVTKNVPDGVQIFGDWLNELFWPCIHVSRHSQLQQ